MTNLDQKALVEAKSAAMQALGYRHGDTVVIGNIPLNIGGAVQSAITAYLAALPPSPAVVPNGWVTVPVVATAAMLDAHYEAHARADTAFAGAQEVWAAMLTASPSPPALDGAGRDGITDEMVRAGAFAAWASTTPFAGLTEAAFRAKSDEHVRIADLGQGTTLEQDMLLDWELNADTFCVLARATLKAAIRSLKETP